MAARRAIWTGALHALAAWTIVGAWAGRAHAGVPAPPRLAARAGLVMDAQSGAILWEERSDVPLPPASTTKILTSVLALESGRLDDEMVVTPNAQAQAPSKLDLRAGQRVRLIDLVYALMLKSANDAAVVVAEGLGGSVEGFAARMNARARQLGATASRFDNPHGLPDDDHVTTAHDLAVILRHALSVPLFRGIASTRTTSIPVEAAGGAALRAIPVKTHNRLLGSYVVPVVGKTGYTRAAGRCFAGAAELGGREVIVVVLGSTNLWGDTRRLIEYGLNVVAPDAASGVRFAAAGEVPASRSMGEARPGRAGKSGKKTVAGTKSKRKPAKASATGRRSTQQATTRSGAPGG